MMAIEINGLKKVYGNGTVALKGIDIKFEEGGFFAILGPNGAGKTTLISIISGLTNKTEGSVKIFGRSIDDEPEKAKSYIGVVPQEFNFNIFETVENIVLDQAGYYGMSRKVAGPAAEKYLRALGLWEKKNEQAQKLSGGMKRRLMIARALVHEPRILILDEPTAGVDIELRRSMWEFLEGLTGEGRTIILTTHYLEEAEKLASHITIINKGEIAESGSLKGLLSKLHTEILILDIDRAVSDTDIEKLKAWSAVRVDENTIEISLNKDQNVNTVISALNEMSLTVKSMRNKSNRLEEFFLSITKNR